VTLFFSFFCLEGGRGGEQLNIKKKVFLGLSQQGSRRWWRRRQEQQQQQQQQQQQSEQQHRLHLESLYLVRRFRGELVFFSPNETTQ
jgi:hypothetical protein